MAYLLVYRACSCVSVEESGGPKSTFYLMEYSFESCVVLSFAFEFPQLSLDLTCHGVYLHQQYSQKILREEQLSISPPQLKNNQGICYNVSVELYDQSCHRWTTANVMALPLRLFYYKMLATMVHQVILSK